MIRKDDLAALMVQECDICIHLHSKLGPQSASYRPSEGQRTSVELLRYLAICGIAGIRCMADKNWKQFRQFTDRVATMSVEEFPAAMARQREEIREFFAGIGEAELENQEAPLPGGGTRPLGIAILAGPFKWLTAYKLQLFLYAKASGASGIGTANAWAGIDAPPRTS